MSRTAAEVERMEPDERLGILRELEEIGSRVNLFADNWIHFYLKFACLTRELGISPKEKPAEVRKADDDGDLEVTHGGMFKEFM